MKPQCLIVGMGIGQLYRSVLTSDYNVYTLDTDPSKGADYTDLQLAVDQHRHFQLIVICTPNHTHYSLADCLADYADLILVEKPGVMDPALWMKLTLDHPRTRFMMIKNNQWRSNLQDLREQAMDSQLVTMHWLNHSRIPSPGSWFTDSSRALGGVSADLMPHLLSFVAAFEGDRFSRCLQRPRILKTTNHSLESITHTDYGVIDRSGVYDVDDRAEVTVDYGDRIYHLTADWATGQGDDRNIYFQDSQYEFGLCPEDAYLAMIHQAQANLDNQAFWQNQLLTDLWIQDIILG